MYFSKIEQVINRCEVDFNGKLRLRFLFDPGGYGDQAYGELEETHFIIRHFNEQMENKK